jgi:phospholipase/carboxylesterase
MQAVEINTGANPQASVIWLHGLGADGHDFEPIVPSSSSTSRCASSSRTRRCAR